MAFLSLTHDEIAWAREAMAAGDSLAEIAAECGVDLLVMAKALGVDRYRPPSLRWRQSVRDGSGSVPSRWIGGLLKEVARARYAAGEMAKSLAVEARVQRRAMEKAVRGARCQRSSARPTRMAA